MDDNPYAPSRADDVAEAPPSHGWVVKGGSLWVTQHAVLPMTDPFSGKSRERMELYRLDVRWRLIWARSLYVGSLLALALYEGELAGWHRSVFLAVTATGLLCGLFAMLFRGPVRIQVFLAPATAARRKIAHGFMFWSIIAFALIAMVPLFCRARS